MPFKQWIPLSKIYPKEIIQQKQKHICMKMLVTPFLIFQKSENQPKGPPLEEKVNKLWYILWKTMQLRENKEKYLWCNIIRLLYKWMIKH